MVENVLKTAMLIFMITLWLPTGPGDLIFIPLIINAIGLEMYILISAVMIIYLYKSVHGKTISDKIHTIKREIKSLI